MKTKVIVFDLDGTLLGGNNEIIGGKDTLKLLQNLKEAGCRLAICTGRLDHDIKCIDRKYHLDITERISQNGAVIVNQDVVSAKTMDSEEAKEVLKLLERHEVRVELNTISNRYWLEERDPDFPKELYDSHHIVSDYKVILDNQPCVLYLVIGENEVLDTIQGAINSHYKNIKAMRTSNTSLEILNKNASKGKAMITMYPNHTLYAIGDSQNDIDMFPYAYKSYLVGGKQSPEASYHCDTILEALQDIENDIKGVR